MAKKNQFVLEPPLRTVLYGIYVAFLSTVSKGFPPVLWMATKVSSTQDKLMNSVCRGKGREGKGREEKLAVHTVLLHPQSKHTCSE